MTIMNLQDREVIDYEIMHSSFQRVIDKAYELGHMRAVMQIMEGTLKTSEWHVSYLDVGNPAKPFVFEDENTANQFAVDLAKRSFTDIDVKEVKK